MPKSNHHVTCFTEDADAVHQFLTEVVGMTELDEVIIPADVAIALLGWPDGNPGCDGRIYGQGTSGLVEVLQIPPAMRGQIRSGVALISFMRRDVEDATAKTAALASSVRGPHRMPTSDGHVVASVMTVADLDFEFIRFEGS
jgi:catechol 2,3-dioxygenase-like lactoylglutathione lyase family enzyme